MADNNVHQISDRRRSDGNGNGGGDMPGDLEKRVEKLETNMGDIKKDLAILTTRSENFCTRNDLLELANTFKTTQLELANTFKVEQMSLRVELHKAIADQTKWMVITIFGVATVSLAVAKFLF